MKAKFEWIDWVCGPKDNTGQWSDVFKGGIRMVVMIGDGHNSKTCTKRRKSRDCDANHPLILHGFAIKEKWQMHIREGNQEERSR